MGRGWTADALTDALLYCYLLLFTPTTQLTYNQVCVDLPRTNPLFFSLSSFFSSCFSKTQVTYNQIFVDLPRTNPGMLLFQIEQVLYSIVCIYILYIYAHVCVYVYTNMLLFQIERVLYSIVYILLFQIERVLSSMIYIYILCIYARVYMYIHTHIALPNRAGII